jgi:hypothetical protein
LTALMMWVIWFSWTKEVNNKTITICSIKEGSGPSQLERRDKTASVTVKGQNVGVPAGLL